MSLTSLESTAYNLTLDGLITIDADEIVLNGQTINLSQYVPYSNATSNITLGSYKVISSAVPTSVNDLTNKNYVDNKVSSTSSLLVPYSGATGNITLGNNNLSVSNAGQVSFSNLIRTELNNVLAGYSPASIVIGDNFGTITNAAGVYQSTSTGPGSYASLFLGNITPGEKYSISLSLKCIDPNYFTNIYIYEASLPNFSGGGISLLSFNIPPNTTGFTVFTGSFVPTLTKLLLVFSTQIISGINTLYWNQFTLTTMGSVINNLITPTTNLQGANKIYVDNKVSSASSLLVPYTGAISNLNLGSNNIIANTAQFTGITNATPSLALGVDGVGNLRSFTVLPNLIPLNNVWTGVNYYNDQVSFNANVGAFGGQFLIDGYDLGYTGNSLTASTGASISYSSPMWTCSTISSRTALITFNLSSYIGKSVKITWSNVAPTTFFVSPYPYFVITNNGNTVYSSPQPMSNTAVNYTFTFTPTTAITNILITIQGTGTPSVSAIRWTGFAIIEVDTTISNALFNGNIRLSEDLYMSLLKKLYVYYVSSTNNAGLVSNSSGDLSLFTGTSGTSNRITILASGNVGVANASPSGTFDVGGIIRMGNYTGGNYDNIQFLRGTGSGEYPNIRCQDNYFGLYVSNTGGWCSDSQTGDMVMRPQISFRVGINGAASSLVCHNNSNVGINIATPVYKLDVAGSMRVKNGDDSMTYYGANASWSSYLVVGSGTTKQGVSTAQCISTNGNLHLDGGNNNSIYYGYYANSNITPNDHRFYGSNMYLATGLPQQNNIYAYPLVLGDSGQIGRSQAIAYQVIAGQSLAWGGGQNMTYAFYKYNANTSVSIRGKMSYYVGGSTRAYPTLRVYSQSYGIYWYFSFEAFTNNTYNHLTFPFEIVLPGNGYPYAGWFDVYIYNNGNCITDTNDQLWVATEVLPGSSW